MTLRTQLFALTALALLSACDEKKSSDGMPLKSPAQDAAGSGGESQADEKKKPSAKEEAKKASALPDKKLVDPIVNPKGKKPYAGPTGSVQGVVRITGDKPPALPEVLAKMDAKCDVSRGTYGVLFREGENRELADVLVAVTHYDGFVPAKSTDVEVWAKGCAWDSRTYALTYGQRLKIDGVDNRPYVPELLGQPMPAQLFVLPTAPPVFLPPQKPGRYKLVDSMRLYSVAEVFVVPFATMDVTGTDGAFKVEGIPVGEASINALLPQTGATVTKKIKIEAGKTTTIDLELNFDQVEYDKKEKPTPLDELPAPDLSPSKMPPTPG